VAVDAFGSNGPNRRSQRSVGSGVDFDRTQYLNIAEGNGKYTPKDRCRFFDIAHGSALECAAGLDILVAKAKLTPDEIRPGKESLQRIVRMLIGLIKRNSSRDYEKGMRPN